MKKFTFTIIALLAFALTEISAQGVSNVSLSGLFVEAETVTGSYLADLTGVSDPQYQYNWYIVDAGVDTTATGSGTLSYTVANGDIGLRLLLRVILLDGTTEIDTAYSSLSPVITANTPPVASSVTITVISSPNPGQTLVGNYSYSDAENDPQGTSTFQWVIADTEGGSYSDITGATSQTYLMVAGDVGKWIKFRVTPVSTRGSTPGTAVLSSAVNVVSASNNAPVASSVSIDILTELNVGASLLGKYTYSDSENDPEGTSTYQWRIAGTETGTYSDIDGATGQAYTITSANQGKWLKFMVTPVATNGVTPGTAVTSPAVGPVNSAPSVSDVSIPLSIQPADVVTVTYSFDDPDNDADVSLFQWYLNGVAIADATTDTYTVKESDAGSILKVKVTPKSDPGYPDTGTPVESNAVTVAVTSLPVASRVCIGGKRKEGRTLTGYYTYTWQTRDEDENSTVYEWLVDGSVVSTGSKTYEVQAGDLDKTIQFRVTPVSDPPRITGVPVTSANLAWFTMTRTDYSISESDIPLVAEPTGGSFASSDGGVYGDMFDPSSLDPADSPFSIAYTYEYPAVDGGCIQNAYIDFTVSESAVFFAGIDEPYCYETVSDIITVRNVPDTATILGFSLSNPAALISLINDTTVQVNPQILGAGTTRDFITFHYYNGGAPYYIKSDVVVDSVGTDLSISNLYAEYCQESPNATIFSQNMYPAGGTGDWSSTLLESEDNFTAVIDPSEASTAGFYSIDFTYTSPLGCSRSVSEQTYINPTPVADFTIVDGCIENSTDTTEFTNLTVSEDIIDSWLWNFGDLSDNLSTEYAPSHLYKTAGNRNVRLIATTIKGCRDTVNHTIELGIKPMADFYWEDDCFHAGEDLKLFDDTESQSTITSRRWLFDEAGEILDVLNPTYQKDAPGIVTVKYFVSTAYSNCGDTATKSIFIRPTINLGVSDYSDDFEGGDNLWFPDNSPGNNWTLGTPDRSVMKTAASGVNSWYTAFDPLNQENVNIAVEGPCFDFTGSDRPMISMKIFKMFDRNRDGAALQYKIGNSPSWEHLGTLDDGINWYNSVLISGRPGGTQIGWTSVKTEYSWVEARQKMDMLNNEKDVKLRIVYGSDGTPQLNDGFAFDDIRITERTRTVLVEHFTNNSEEFYVPDASLIINEHVGNAPKDVVNIQYHTNYPGSDVFYNDNPADPSARKLFYGITRIPYTLYGGGTGVDFARPYDYIIADADSLDMKKRSMVDPLFEINLSAGVTGGIVSVTGDVKALMDISESNMTLNIAVVAREITNVVAPNGEVVFRNVLRKMLPSAGGTDMKKIWVAGESSVFGEFSWVVSGVYDASELEVIAFLQNNNTKKVFQAASSGILSGINGVNDFNAQNNRFSLYPNPASDHIELSFGEGVARAARIVIYNHTGVAVRTEAVAPGSDKLVIDDLKLPDGFYIIRMYEGAIATGYRKLIITER